MNKIEFNTPEGSEERQATKPLTLQEEERVVMTINHLLNRKDGDPIIKPEDLELMQRFVNHYQNLNHYATTSQGLYAMDKDPKNLLHDFWQTSSDACPLEAGEAEKQEKLFQQYVDKFSFKLNMYI